MPPELFPRSTPQRKIGARRFISFKSSSKVPLLSSGSHCQRTTAAVSAKYVNKPKPWERIRRRITKCFIFGFVLTITGYYFLMETSLPSLLEDLECPIKTWKYPTCSHALLQNIPSPDDWLAIRQKYRNAVSDEIFSLEPSSWRDGSAHGFHVPIEIRWSKQRGRGVYATEFIPNGTLVWDSRFNARVPDACTARKFVHSLTNVQACDVIIWGYPVTHHGQSHVEWSIDLDPSSFTNEANTPDEVNVVDKVLDPTKTLEPGAHTMWSTRDIPRGQELVSSYEDLRNFDPRKNMFWHVKLVLKSWGIIFLY